MKIIAIDICKKNLEEAPAPLLKSLLNGMLEAGAKIEYFNTSNMLIEQCRACTSNADFNSDGSCRCNDDMSKILPALKTADAWLFAYQNDNSLLYSKMRTILDRLEPLFPPQLEYIDGEDNFGLSKNGHSGKLLLFSTTLAWDISSFDNVILHFKTIADLYSKEFLPPILRPHSEVLTAYGNMNIHTEDIYQSAFDAGYEFAKKGAIASEKLANISRDLVSKDSFLLELVQNLSKD